MNFFRIAILLPVLFSVGCSSLPTVPVHSEYLNESVNTHVDSEVASYYLEHYLKGEHSQPAFDQSINELYQSQNNKLPSRANLKEISQKFSPDFAALFFVEHLMKDKENQRLLELFQSILNSGKENLSAPLVNSADYQVVFVPGWNYIDNGYLTGSDLALPRKIVSDLGIQNLLVKTPSNGSVDASAEVISKIILQQSTINKKIIMVGASAAGPAIHLTLGEKLSHQQSANVVAWINLGGILKGSPLVDHFQKWPQKAAMNMVAWFKGWDNDDIVSMSTGPSIERFNRLKLSPSLHTVNYLALGLSGNLSDLSETKYPFIVDEGPNDGLTLLPDVIAPNSSTLVAVNSDHYFGQDKRINDKIVALLKSVIFILEHTDPAYAESS
ncbi:MAG: hypothetical protein DRQ47_05610 [Gammaproteobacteria bacterium]|nr:MAG: hypothetical protein DRQ47_05610 [Gammaproteobacteria bacterium]